MLRNPVARRACILLCALGACNGVIWAVALGAFHARLELLAMALLAYTFGVRHALDADHICAIDNVVRKLMQERKRPIDVGLFFSLGHSTVVIALTVAIALGASAVKGNLPALRAFGSVAGTSFSVIFLVAIAAVNVFVLADIARAIRAVRRGEGYSQRTIDATLARRGLIARLVGPMVAMVDNSRRMYPIGLLFGLGFDTATEVGLLGIAAIGAGKGLPLYEILIFPLLFTAGMTLLDTADGMLMLAAYGWALLEPLRKLYYNFSVTALSIAAALFVVVVEAAGAVGKGGAFFNDNLRMIGVAIVSLFAAGLVIQVGVVEGTRAFAQSRAAGRQWLDRRDAGGLLE
ncbi:MAG: HoxN/HupN/NixA family nickel/cobalt transporter [Candidatus Eremiobacteraeota bacterium]|nr:HoxN/HupN/NixA family nickel/cobalt transporter [Candidatus Eremiobacteraeota bacterium]